MEGGHFTPGRNAGALLDERNVHPQCNWCNEKRSGNGTKYTEYMQKRYGQDVVDELHFLSHKGREWSLEELLELRVKWKDEIKELERSLA